LENGEEDKRKRIGGESFRTTGGNSSIRGSIESRGSSEIDIGLGYLTGKGAKNIGGVIGSLGIAEGFRNSYDFSNSVSSIRRRHNPLNNLTQNNGIQGGTL
jgi:hypothetical protein